MSIRLIVKWVTGCQKAVSVAGAGAVTVARSISMSDLPIMASSAIIKAVVAGVTGVTGIAAGVAGIAGVAGVVSKTVFGILVEGGIGFPLVV